MVKGWVGTISPAGRSLLSGRREPRRLADRQCGVHAQLALCLRARQRRRPPDQGQVRRGAAADRAAAKATSSAATLGGWNLAVSKYLARTRRTRPISLLKFLASTEVQKSRALQAQPSADRSISLYDDADIAKAAADHPALEGRLPERRAASLGADQGQVQRSLERVLDRRARDAFPATARPPTTSNCSRPT